MNAGGSVDPGEEPLHAAAREALEETGLVVELDVEPLHVGPIREGEPLVATFLVRAFEGEPRPGSDALAVRWVSAAELLERRNRYAAYNRKVLEAVGSPRAEHRRSTRC